MKVYLYIFVVMDGTGSGIDLHVMFAIQGVRLVSLMMNGGHEP